MDRSFFACGASERNQSCALFLQPIRDAANFDVLQFYINHAFHVVLHPPTISSHDCWLKEFSEKFYQKLKKYGSVYAIGLFKKLNEIYYVLEHDFNNIGDTTGYKNTHKHL